MHLAFLFASEASSKHNKRTRPIGNWFITLLMPFLLRDMKDPCSCFAVCLAYQHLATPDNILPIFCCQMLIAICSFQSLLLVAIVQERSFGSRAFADVLFLLNTSL